MLLAISAVLSVVASLQTTSLDLETKAYQATLMEERKNNIRDAALIATAVIEDIVTRLGTDGEARQALHYALSNARFAANETGYFFIFDEKGNYLVHSLNPDVEGTSGMGLTDPNGVKITIELQEQARRGGGFIEYVYDKEGSTTPQPKISYSSPISNSNGWFLGTGLYTDDIEKSTQVYRKEAQDRMMQQIATILSISTILAIIVSGLMIFVSAKISAPIKSMLNSFEDIAKGEGDLTYRINVKGTDEVAQLGIAFNQFIDKLHHIISDISITTSQVTNAALSINTQTTELQKQLKNHNNETDLVVTAITELNSTAQEVARNVNDVAGATSNANQDSQEALKLVTLSSQAVSSLDANIKKSSDNMSSLQQQTTQINTVLQVIGDIADQTNLLALNAAIEAARAGEQGRGFAVVADEVRNLASRTQDSTIEIKKMLDELHRFVQQAVTTMSESQKSCEDVSQSASDISIGLDSVGKSVDTIDLMMDQIATAVTEQSVVTAEVNENLVVIRDIVLSLLESNNDSSLVATELGKAGKQLGELVAQFKV
ncbi:chemotaxis protein [Shewanella sairae]|uniref:Chemotaxis protein n=2 Tax=Shewanella sairae TaxID=190310 RepID=A0ABQ4PSS6_9GAMM|nr:chemotaxis protein [Shewanella sairae]